MAALRPALSTAWSLSNTEAGCQWHLLRGVHVAGADFFTTEVWTPRGLITYYTLFVIDLRSRGVHVAGSTPTPDAWFIAQAAR
jgi:hypothetical protein